MYGELRRNKTHTETLQDTEQLYTATKVTFARVHWVEFRGNHSSDSCQSGLALSFVANRQAPTSTKGRLAGFKTGADALVSALAAQCFVDSARAGRAVWVEKKVMLAGRAPERLTFTRVA